MFSKFKSTPLSLSIHKICNLFTNFIIINYYFTNIHENLNSLEKFF